MDDRWDTATPVIACQEVHKVYSRPWFRKGTPVRALDGVSFTLMPGQVLGLIGPNGAGKTTLLNLVAGLIFPTQGHIEVCGHPARSPAARATLGYMPEYPAFIGNYTARQMLRYQAALHGLSRRQIEERIDVLLRQVDLLEAADRACYTFSQGMKQRLALGVALVGHPRVLILDEPSNGLDPVGIIELRRMLKQIGQAGTAIFISSHRLGELEKLTDSYIFLNKGKVVPCDARASRGDACRLRVGVLSGGYALASALAASQVVLETSETELVLEVPGPQAVPELVRDLVLAGASITGVDLQQPDIEAMFMRLYAERSRA